MDRMLRKDAPSEDVTSTSDIVPPTTISSKAKALFTEDHVRTLHRLLNDMLGNVPISRNEILYIKILFSTQICMCNWFSHVKDGNFKQLQYCIKFAKQCFYEHGV